MFLTTAIAYPNGPPHLGHLYESVLADFTKRVVALSGKKVTLQTGTDEHGKKMEQTAKTANLGFKELCDRNSSVFKELHDRLGTSYDTFFRTSTFPGHLSCVQTVLQNLLDRDLVYLATYKGWYCTREESYVTNREAASTEFKDSVTGKPLEQIEQPAYFFRLGMYQKKIVDYLTNQSIIQPPNYVEEILSRLNHPLQDLCISRGDVSWGIPFPNSDQTVYVWFDALLNYVSGRNKNGVSIPGDPVHIIGCDILWFHAVIYPAVLMASGLEEFLPKKILVHGFVTDADGQKMSKSLGNVTSIETGLESPGLRYWLLSSASLGQNLCFNSENIRRCYTGELVNNLGNLAQRTMGLCKKFDILPFIPQTSVESHPFIEEFLISFDPKVYIKRLLERAHELNLWITKTYLSASPETKKTILLEHLAQIKILFQLALPLAPKECEHVLTSFSEGAKPTPFKAF